MILKIQNRTFIVLNIYWMLKIGLFHSSYLPMKGKKTQMFIKKNVENKPFVDPFTNAQKTMIPSKMDLISPLLIANIKVQ